MERWFRFWRGISGRNRPVKCPACGVRYYWSRRDRLQMEQSGEVRIRCVCGCIYWIVDKGNGLYYRTNNEGRQPDVLRKYGAEGD